MPTPTNQLSPKDIGILADLLREVEAAGAPAGFEFQSELPRLAALVNRIREEGMLVAALSFGAVLQLRDALGEYERDGEPFGYHSCQGPWMDGTHPCATCRSIMANLLEAAEALRMDDFAADCRTTLKAWRRDV